MSGATLTPKNPLPTRLSQNTKTLDEVVITTWPNPKSYTGENLVEITCHGNPLIIESILNSIYSLGGRPARPGEFTERAFLHGRIDLTKAEAVLDILHARSNRSLLAGQRALAGGLSERLMADREKLLQLLARIEAWIDFPDEDIQPEVGDGFRSEIKDLLKSVASLLETAPLGHRLRSGYRLVLAGPPNAGKSSLLNALLGLDRALVSSIPGTTRDTVEESILLAGFSVRLIDTAGLRPSSDPLEQEGMARTRAAMKTADLVLALIDSHNLQIPAPQSGLPLEPKFFLSSRKRIFPPSKRLQASLSPPRREQDWTLCEVRFPNTSPPTSPHQVRMRSPSTPATKTPYEEPPRHSPAPPPHSQIKPPQSLSLPISDLPFSPSSPSLELAHRKMSLTAFFPNSVSANETLLHPRPPPPFSPLS